MLTNNDLVILEAMANKDYRTLAIWYCRLNSWEWPKELPDPVPVQADRPNRRSALMAWISERIGERLISYEWNINRDWVGNRTLTADEHEDFWRGVYEGNQAALAWHLARAIAHRSM